MINAFACVFVKSSSLSFIDLGVHAQAISVNLTNTPYEIKIECPKNEVSNFLALFFAFFGYNGYIK